MTRRSLALAIAVSSAVAPPNLLAQESGLAPGASLRLLARSGPEIRGDLVEWGRDTLRLRPAGSESVRAVPILEIERLRVSEPRPRTRGALRGLMIGSIAGALSLGVVAMTDCSEGVCFGIGALVGGVAGGGIGTTIGFVWPGTRWADVPVEPQTVDL